MHGVWLTVWTFVLRLVLERVAERRREALSPRQLVQQHQVLHLPASVAPPADLYRHFPALEHLQCLFGSHGLGGGFVAPVARAHVDGLAADFAHVAILLRASRWEALDVLQRHEHARHRLFARLHAATQDLEVVQVGAEAAGRH